MSDSVTLFLFVFFTIVSPFYCYEANLNYDYPTTKYFTQKLDHFNPTIDDTFLQRYLISTQYWGGKVKPIFFYTGNEGDITVFANNTGFMWDIAPEFSAMVVFAEHRFYGNSKPFPNLEPTPENVHNFGQFTVEQALADYVELISYLKRTIPGAVDSPVIVFGGSYGGMLAAWLRRLYPHIVVGALAASAPVRNFPGLVSCEAFNSVVTKDFSDGPDGLACVSNIRNSWDEIERTAKQPHGMSTLAKIFHLCESLKETDKLEDWLSEAWSSLAMVNYPYATDFLNPLPAYPVKETCKRLSKPHLKGDILLDAIRNAAGVFYNYSGQAKCFSLGAESPGISTKLWAFQTCTEMVMPFCSHNDMFKPANWSIAEFTKDCQKTFGTTPRPDWARQQFGGDDWSEQSNVIFSNGQLDPWQGGGILKSDSDKILTLYIDEAAHHLDLRHANVQDPKYVTIARLEEMDTIAVWLHEYTLKKV